MASKNKSILISDREIEALELLTFAIGSIKDADFDNLKRYDLVHVKNIIERFRVKK